MGKYIPQFDEVVRTRRRPQYSVVGAMCAGHGMGVTQ